MASGDNLNSLRTAERSEGQSRAPAEAITRSVDEHVRFGRSGARSTRTRLYHYDRHEGVKGAAMKAEADQADRMSDKAARAALQTLHVAFGVETEPDATIYDFDHAMFLCYALNGGSQIGPHERVQFRVVRGPVVSAFEYKKVTDTLGIDLRRFFRAFANDVVDACRHLYLHADVLDDGQLEMRERMIKLASARNLSRYPFLVADCCDAATNISEVEYSSVMASKVAVIGATSNAVDQMRNAVHVRSSDNYDSSLGRTVSAVPAPNPNYHD